MPDPANVHEFVALLTRNAHRVYSYIRVQLPHESDADDVFQETSRVLWEKFDTFEPGTKFTAWAMSIAHIEIMRFRRRSGRQPLSFSDDLLEQLSAKIESSLENASDRLTALAHCYKQLTPPDQKLIDARYAPGATTKSVAKRMNRSVDSVYRSLRRIHEALFDCIKREVSEERSA